MGTNKIIDGLQTQLRGKLAERATHEQTITTTRGKVVDNGEPTAEQAEVLRSAGAAITALDTDIELINDQLEQRTEEEGRNERAASLRRDLFPEGDPTEERGKGGAKVTNEERTYTARKDNRGEASFFVDAFNAQRGGLGPSERLQRHMKEVQVEGEISERAASTGSFSGLVVPQYLVDMAALQIRNGRPTANVVTGLALPAKGMALIIPRGTTGAAVASQAVENSALQNTDEVWTNLTVPVVTIGGQQDVSRQSLERGTEGIDQLIYLDLAGAYHAELDRQVLNGSGAANQMLGILQTAGILAATAFGAAATAQNVNKKLAGLIGAIAGQGVGISPKLSIMNPRRWAFLTGEADNTGRPLINPGLPGMFNGLGSNDAVGGYSGDAGPRAATTVGTLQGLPVITDANVPTNVGTNLEDLITVIDPTKALLWEDGDGMPRELRFEQTLGQNLTVKLAVYGYAAFTAGRYPQAFGKVGGLDTTATNGLTAPTF